MTAARNNVQHFVITRIDEVFADGIRVPFRFGKNRVNLTVLGVQTPIEPASLKNEEGEEIAFIFPSCGSVELSDESGQRTFTVNEGTKLRLKAAKVMIVS